MSRLSLRLPDSLPNSARQLAAKESISINPAKSMRQPRALFAGRDCCQLITLALAEKVSALMTEEYLGRRAERGSRQKFEAALAKVADTEPPEHDRL
jgi:hypothetical protein